MLLLSAGSIALDEGGSAEFNVRLAAAPPSGGVAVTLMQPANTDVSVDANAGSPGSQSVLRFDSGNWSAGLDVTVAARHDATLDDETARIGLSIAGGDSRSVEVSVRDDDQAQISGLPALIALDEGASRTLTGVALTARPSAETVITFAVPEGSPVTLAPARLSFTPEGWNSLQRLSVTAAQDADAVDASVAVAFSATGGGFDGLSGSVRVDIADDDAVELKVSSPGATHLAEGAQLNGTVSLGSQPDGAVTVTLASDSTALQLCDPGGRSVGCADPADLELSFTAADWNIPQGYRVVAVQDDRLGDGGGTLSFTASGGGYAGVSHSLRMTAGEDETPALRLSTTSVTVGEATAGGSFTVRLDTRPERRRQRHPPRRGRNRQADHAQPGRPDLHRGQLGRPADRLRRRGRGRRQGRRIRHRHADRLGRGLPRGRRLGRRVGRRQRLLDAGHPGA